MRRLAWKFFFKRFQCRHVLEGSLSAADKILASINFDGSEESLLSTSPEEKETLLLNEKETLYDTMSRAVPVFTPTSSPEGSEGVVADSSFRSKQRLLAEEVMSKITTSDVNETMGFRTERLFPHIPRQRYMTNFPVDMVNRIIVHALVDDPNMDYVWTMLAGGDAVPEARKRRFKEWAVKRYGTEMNNGNRVCSVPLALEPLPAEDRWRMLEHFASLFGITVERGPVAPSLTVIKDFIASRSGPPLRPDAQLSINNRVGAIEYRSPCFIFSIYSENISSSAVIATLSIRLSVPEKVFITAKIVSKMSCSLYLAYVMPNVLNREMLLSINALNFPGFVIRIGNVTEVPLPKSCGSLELVRMRDGRIQLLPGFCSVWSEISRWGSDHYRADYDLTNKASSMECWKFLRNVTGTRRDIEISLRLLTEVGAVNYYSGLRTTRLAATLAVMRNNVMDVFMSNFRYGCGLISSHPLFQKFLLEPTVVNARNLVLKKNELKLPTLSDRLLRKFIRFEGDVSLTMLTAPYNYRMFLLKGAEKQIFNALASARVRLSPDKVLVGDFVLVEGLHLAEANTGSDEAGKVENTSRFHVREPGNSWGVESDEDVIFSCSGEESGEWLNAGEDADEGAAVANRLDNEYDVENNVYGLYAMDRVRLVRTEDEAKMYSIADVVLPVRKPCTLHDSASNTFLATFAPDGSPCIVNTRDFVAKLCVASGYAPIFAMDTLSAEMKGIVYSRVYERLLQKGIFFRPLIRKPLQMSWTILADRREKAERDDMYSDFDVSETEKRRNSDTFSSEEFTFNDGEMVSNKNIPLESPGVPGGGNTNEIVPSGILKSRDMNRAYRQRRLRKYMPGTLRCFNTISNIELCRRMGLLDDFEGGDEYFPNEGADVFLSTSDDLWAGREVVDDLFAKLIPYRRLIGAESVPNSSFLSKFTCEAPVVNNLRLENSANNNSFMNQDVMSLLTDPMGTQQHDVQQEFLTNTGYFDGMQPVRPLSDPDNVDAINTTYTVVLRSMESMKGYCLTALVDEYFVSARPSTKRDLTFMHQIQSGSFFLSALLPNYYFRAMVLHLARQHSPQARQRLIRALKQFFTEKASRVVVDETVDAPPTSFEKPTRHATISCGIPADIDENPGAAVAQVIQLLSDEEKSWEAYSPKGPAPYYRFGDYYCDICYMPNHSRMQCPSLQLFTQFKRAQIVARRRVLCQEGSDIGRMELIGKSIDWIVTLGRNSSDSSWGFRVVGTNLTAINIEICNILAVLVRQAGIKDFWRAGAPDFLVVAGFEKHPDSDPNEKWWYQKGIENGAEFPPLRITRINSTVVSTREEVTQSIREAEGDSLVLFLNLPVVEKATISVALDETLDPVSPQPLHHLPPQPVLIESNETRDDEEDSLKTVTLGRLTRCVKDEVARQGGTRFAFSKLFQLLDDQLGLHHTEDILYLSRTDINHKWGFQTVGLRILPINFRQNGATTAIPRSPSEVVQHHLIGEYKANIKGLYHTDESKHDLIKPTGAEINNLLFTDTVFRIARVSGEIVRGPKQLRELLQNDRFSKALRLTLILDILTLPCFTVSLRPSKTQENGGDGVRSSEMKFDLHRNSAQVLGLYVDKSGIISRPASHTCFGVSLLKEAPKWCNLRCDYRDRNGKLSKEFLDDDDDDEIEGEEGHDLISNVASPELLDYGVLSRKIFSLGEGHKELRERLYMAGAVLDDIDGSALDGVRWRLEEVNGVSDVSRKDLNKISDSILDGTGTADLKIRMIIPVN